MTPIPLTNVVAPEVPESGDLQHTSFARLYCLAAAAETTGQFTLRLGDRTLDVQFKKGNPVYANSSLPEDSLENFLRSRRMASDSHVERAIVEAKRRFGGELQPALFSLGILNPLRDSAKLAERMYGIIGQALVAEKGRFYFSRVEAVAHRMLPLPPGPRWTILLNSLRTLPAFTFERRLAPDSARTFQVQEGLVSIRALPLTPLEERAAAAIQNLGRLAEIVRLNTQNVEHLWRTAYVLREIGMLNFP